MKIAAHPIMVAVALGFLGPAALETPSERRQPSTSLEAPPDADERDRAEALWLAARDAFDAERDAT